MTKDEKKELLTAICGYLPHGVGAQYYGTEEETTLDGDIEGVFPCKEEVAIGRYVLPVEKVKPYLRPMGSLTDKERRHVMALCDLDYIDAQSVDFGEFLVEGSPVSHDRVKKLVVWLNENKFDWWGLIPRGLALPAPLGDFHWIDLGLPSGTLWADANIRNPNDKENGLWSWNAVEQSGFKDSLPDEARFDELRRECRWEWKKVVEGYKVTGKNGESIFLPTEGRRNDRTNTLFFKGAEGGYWMPSGNNLYLNGSGYVNTDTQTGVGLSVRLVCPATKRKHP